MPSREALTASLVLAASACQPPAAEQRWDGEFVSAYSEEGIELCGGSSAFLDAYVQSVGGYWTGRDWEPTEFALELRATPGPTAAGRSTSADEAWVGRSSSALHELAHLVTRTDSGLSSPVLTEGFAEGVGSSRVVEIWADWFSEDHPQDFAFFSAEEFGDTGRYYTSSGQLVAALARKHGIESVRRAYQLAPRDGPADVIEDAFVEAFGEGVYDSFDEIAMEPTCGLRVWQCDPSVVPTVALPFRVDAQRTSDCRADTELVGGDFSGDGNWYPEAVFALELDEETSFMFEEQNTFLYGLSCRQSCEGRTADPPDVVYPYSDIPTTLPPGRYFFSARSADRLNSFSFRFDPI